MGQIAHTASICLQFPALLAVVDSRLLAASVSVSTLGTLWSQRVEHAQEAHALRVPLAHFRHVARVVVVPRKCNQMM